MSEIGITVGLLIAVVGFGWVVYRVVSTLEVRGESSSRADIHSEASLPGAEQIDSHMAQTKSTTIIRYGTDV